MFYLKSYGILRLFMNVIKSLQQLSLKNWSFNNVEIQKRILVIHQSNIFQFLWNEALLFIDNYK